MADPFSLGGFEIGLEVLGGPLRVELVPGDGSSVDGEEQDAVTLVEFGDVGGDETLADSDDKPSDAPADDFAPEETPHDAVDDFLDAPDDASQPEAVDLIDFIDTPDQPVGVSVDSGGAEVFYALESAAFETGVMTSHAGTSGAFARGMESVDSHPLMGDVLLAAHTYLA